MYKLFSMLVVASGTIVGGVSSASAACDCGSGHGAAPAATAQAPKKAPAATARSPKAPTATARSAQAPATAQNGRQTIRRYSTAPAPSNRAATPRRTRGWSGQSWNATQKVFGY